jgi:hypothetical protein
LSNNGLESSYACLSFHTETDWVAQNKEGVLGAVEAAELLISKGADVKVIVTTMFCSYPL